MPVRPLRTTTAAAWRYHTRLSLASKQPALTTAIIRDTRGFRSTMAPEQQSGRVPDKPEGDGGLPRRPKKLIFAPGDIEAPSTTTATSTRSTTTDPSDPSTNSALPTANPALAPHAHVDRTGTPSSVTESEIISHPARAHQFVSNPPLTISQIHPTNPLRQFHAWFRDPRLLPSSAPETCILATASMPSGRVSARAVYLKELDERGWVVYSNWGSREGKGGQVFGKHADGSGSSHQTTMSQTGGSGMDGLGAMPSPEEAAAAGSTGEGNKWAALTFTWATVERQVRIEGLLEPLSRAESEMYWRTRERGSQLGAWASWQSKVLWSADPGSLVNAAAHTRGSGANNPPEVPAIAADCGEVPADIDEIDIDDGRALLEQRVKEVEERFANVEEIPLPPFWGGVRLVPESVEFWQGRRSRLHDRFRYVRVEDGKKGDGTVPPQDEEQKAAFQWRIERLSP